MGLMAERGGNRQDMRQGYRTMARMQRRRSYVASKAGARQDFEPAGQQEATPAPAPAAAPAAAEPSYMAELEQLAQLRDQGVITAEEFDAKKKQLLGI